VASPAAVVVLPWPDPRLSPNNSKGKHWGGISDAREDARANGALAARNYKGAIAPGEPVEMVAWITPPDRRRRDLDNIHASLKSYIDGAAEEIGFDDYQIETVILRREPHEAPGAITIELWKA